MTSLRVQHHPGLVAMGVTNHTHTRVQTPATASIEHAASALFHHRKRSRPAGNRSAKFASPINWIVGKMGDEQPTAAAQEGSTTTVHVRT